MTHVHGHHPKTPTQPLKKPEKKEENFKARDINQDGVLSGSETKGLDGYDGDGNQQVTQDEYKAGRAKAAHEARDARLKAAFDKFDINKDGELSGTETQKLQGYDKNNDGKVDADEFKAGRGAEWHAKLDKKFEEVFNKLEVNDDGVLSGTEAAQHQNWDADGDGKITQDEAKAGWNADRKAAVENRRLNGGKLDEIFRVDKQNQKPAPHHHKPTHPHKGDVKPTPPGGRPVTDQGKPEAPQPGGRVHVR